MGIKYDKSKAQRPKFYNQANVYAQKKRRNRGRFRRFAHRISLIVKNSWDTKLFSLEIGYMSWDSKFVLFEIWEYILGL